MISRNKKSGRCSWAEKRGFCELFKTSRSKIIYCWSTGSARKTWSSTEESTTLHAPGSGHAGPVLSESNPVST